MTLGPPYTRHSRLPASRRSYWQRSPIVFIAVMIALLAAYTMAAHYDAKQRVGSVRPSADEVQMRGMAFEEYEKVQAARLRKEFGR